MNKLIFIKTYEKFHKHILDKLVDDNDTYIRKKSKEGEILSNDFIEIKRELSKYDVSKFVYKFYPYGIYITPDEDFINLIIKLNTKIGNKLPLNFEFDFSVDVTRLNLIDFEKGIPKEIRGVFIGYKLYKVVIIKYGFITSNEFSSGDAYHIWYNLLLDDDLFSFTSNNLSGVIYKKQTDEQIFNILEKLRNKKLIFDDEFKEKIIELYGSMDIYSQNN